MYQSQARHLMNKWSFEKRPFIVIADFELENIKVYPLNALPSDILFNFNGSRNYDNYFVQSVKPEFTHLGLSLSQYKIAFDKVHQELQYGNTFLINLTMRTEVTSSFSLKELFFYSNAKYNLFYKDEFIFFSPEPFVKIKDGYIHSYPMKGTINADIPNAEKVILQNVKEKAEHNTIVDLIRNDLSIVAKQVHVPRFRYVEEIKNNGQNILQVSSEVKGKIKLKYINRLGDTIFNLLPAGSISGAPKPKTVNIIKNVESQKRGFYTGICGIFNGSEFDSCVMIRFIEKEQNKLFYRSGGGITHKSDMMSEYKETLQKIYVPTH
ncbi:MAG: aminodeoxychorismate synthase component I [Bacteroidia bacterium]|nr:aminodeoxychorismate synthase component I [Bacteroidia bacterium]